QRLCSGRRRAETSVAQNEDVLGRETEARELFIIELSEPRPYALLAWIVVSPNKPVHQARSGFQRAGWARGHASARKLDGHRQPPYLIAARPHAGSRISRTQALDLIRLDDLDRSYG